MQNYLTVPNMELFFVIFLAICWGISTFFGARTSIRKAREENRIPLVRIEEAQMGMEKRMNSMEERMTDIERRSDVYGDKMTLVLRSQLSILSHLVNGNSSDKLRQSLQEINDFLVNR